MQDDLIYLDNSAATRMDERVLEAMRAYFFDVYAVATSEFGYSLGIEAREALDSSRERLAKSLGASKDEIVFTSGSTESSNFALKGVGLALGRKKGKHVIVSKIEDFPVLNSAKAMEKMGYKITFLDVDDQAAVNLDQLQNSIQNDTILVSIQHANQEVGTMQDIKAIGEICQEKDVLFHTDATHTFRRAPLDVSRTQVDLVTIAAHTLHGPKGVGGLFIRDGTEIDKWMDGGFQEGNRRAGLENIPGAVGFAEAVDLADEEETQRLAAMRDRVIERAEKEIPDTTLNGHRTKRLPQNANITFHFVEGESMTLHLDMRGFAVSTGSACFSKSLEASHVIMAMGGDHERAHGSIRFTFGRYNRMDDADAVVDAIADVVKRLREISPLSRKEG